MSVTRHGFSYVKTKSIFVSYFKDGTWDEGNLQADDDIKISAFSPALHYGQQAFEGLKAYRRADGRINLFRFLDNGRRLQKSCARLLMPAVPLELFEKAVRTTIKDNEAFMPPHGAGETLYVRPLIIGVGHGLGAMPANEYMFIVMVSPVGPYFGGTLKPVKMMATNYDRAATHGTGQAKVGGNYGGSFLPQRIAREHGCADAIFLDPATHTFIDEVGAANFFGITKDGKYVAPISSSILESITQKSLKVIAKEKLGLTVEERPVPIKELPLFSEVGACGTAAVITPISAVLHENDWLLVRDNVGPFTQKLYDTLTGIQTGDLPDEFGWITIM